MNIKVNRIDKNEALVFEIVVTKPHLAPFSESDEAIMNLLEDAKNKFNDLADPENYSRIKAEQGIHLAKEKVFLRILDSLKFSIKNSLESKFNHICQEIYNWIHDHQEGRLQRWMSECNPQRTKYYFDNDKNIEKDFDEEEDEDDEDGECY